MSRFVEFTFVYLGQLYGNAHPEVGTIMGIAYGAAIGGYVSQFTAMLVSAYFFTGIMKHYGIRPRDCFRIEFTWAEVKPMVVYAVKTSLPGIISGFLELGGIPEGIKDERAKQVHRETHLRHREPGLQAQ